jgi:hypothetical protein
MLFEWLNIVTLLKEGRNWEYKACQAKIRQIFFRIRRRFQHVVNVILSLYFLSQYFLRFSN